MEVNWEYLLSITTVVCVSIALIAGRIDPKDFTTLIVAILSFHGGSLLGRYRLMHFRAKQRKTKKSKPSNRLKQLTLKQIIKNQTRPSTHFGGNRDFRADQPPPKQGYKI